MLDPTKAEVWLVGGGIASLAAAAFLVRDAGVPAARVHILEETGLVGGAMDGARSPVQDGYVTRGGRMLEYEAYRCLWNLLDSIPSLENAEVSVYREIVAFNEEVKSRSFARLIDGSHRIVDAAAYGLDNRDRLELTRLLALPERLLGARRIEDMFSEHFFQTLFWQMWRTTFAFQTWHSAIEMKRYCLRFIQEFPRLHDLSGIRRTKYNQYDSIIRPLRNWLTAQGVDVRSGARVVDVDFDKPEGHRRAIRLHLREKAGESTIDLGPDDATFVTLGSITSDSAYGGNDSVPELIRDRRDGGWALWERIADKGKDFGRPNTFFGNIDENKWESFTLTLHGETFLKRIVEFTGNQPGTGGLMTFFESSWLMSLVNAYQPHFPDMPPETFTMWGYGLFIDRQGDYVRKPMAQCTGKEILTELLRQFGFDDIFDEVLATTNVTTVIMPYASALFSRRDIKDRPPVIPEGARNFAFLGQFVEIPEDTVFTVEYSVHGAMIAVYETFGVKKEIPPIYHGLMDPKVGLKALEAAFT
ncbi:oleate hydratase [Rhodoblastus acidophilus]|uniref:Oleate hydratase n=1 Tax=Candidatus Rhodoblastus alkanivorans TaxID=2954117 RepID=A0ABS9Z895_9HYPH|nr:oleate hydratase [Candidatus Rhodoblastus alkanivorans]MCI4679625.1 oleate hydratase [Candidatus Rhodoblastus alkanivorans]MCI4683661.1 oleate hydratase [Candidatus Rhodoblastus alkanivorans]MDI4640978.1 oleate hydratase [Rhodoblastus acidophilus]